MAWVEDAFLRFDVVRLCFEPDEFCEVPGRITRIAADWAAANQLGLLEMLGKRGSRPGWMTAATWSHSRAMPGWISVQPRQPARIAAGADADESLAGGNQAAAQPLVAHLRPINRSESACPEGTRQNEPASYRPSERSKKTPVR